MNGRIVVTMHGKPLTLLGPRLRVGDAAPEFRLLDAELREVTLADFKGHAKLISVTPSLDTKVCDLQARRFNQEAASLGARVAVLNVSMDLPFAIGRFCSVAGINRLKALSDHRDAAFGLAYGVLVKELRLLARSIFVLDHRDVIRYLQIVPEMTDHPDYQRALAEIGDNRLFAP